MNPLELVGTQALIVSIVATCVVLVLFYFIIRAGVFAGMRDYQKWIEKRRVAQAATAPLERVPLTGPYSGNPQ